MIEGKFTPAEMKHGWEEAGMRAIRVIFEGRSEHGVNGQKPFDWKNEIIGAVGELAVSLGLNLAWTGMHGRKSLDVGGFIEVRAVIEAHKRLLIYLNEPIDRSDTPFVLVDLSKLPHWCIVGWMLGKECHREEWKYNSERPCYLVPRDVLQDPELLLAMSRWR